MGHLDISNLRYQLFCRLSRRCWSLDTPGTIPFPSSRARQTETLCGRQNANQPTLSAVGYGFAVAWRRFVAVMIGITAAFLWSFLPPKVTQKERVRKTYANVVKELGTAICQVVSFANCKKDDSPAPKVVVKNIGALRAQTQRTMLGISMIRYEVSLRGPWPTRNYLALKNLILEMLDLIGQLLGVLASLKGAWVRAVMQRTQLSNSRFLGDMLVSLQLVSTALAQGTALPMIYNPLVEVSLVSPRMEDSFVEAGLTRV